MARYNSYGRLDMPPGTELMADDGKEKKAYIPHPSADRQDPLNWSLPWKRKELLAVYVQC